MTIRINEKDIKNVKENMLIFSTLSELTVMQNSSCFTAARGGEQTFSPFYSLFLSEISFPSS